MIARTVISPHRFAIKGLNPIAVRRMRTDCSSC